MGPEALIPVARKECACSAPKVTCYGHGTGRLPKEVQIRLGLYVGGSEFAGDEDGNDGGGAGAAAKAGSAAAAPVPDASAAAGAVPAGKRNRDRRTVGQIIAETGRAKQARLDGHLEGGPR